MTKEQPLRFKTISEYHRFRGLEKPQHPLSSIVNFDDEFKLLSETNLEVFCSILLVHLNATLILSTNTDDKLRF
jgi:hypothetical protein